MELEPELLLQEARESVEAAQSYRRELGQRLQGLREARRQVGGPRPAAGRRARRAPRAPRGRGARASQGTREGTQRAGRGRSLKGKRQVWGLQGEGEGRPLNRAGR